MTGLQENSQQSTNTFREDFLASIVVFLVALPLCMGIAIASGVPVAAGLITGIIGGLVVGVLAGAPLQVSGPAAGLTVIVYEIVQQHGLEMLGIVVLIGGAIQLVAGLLGLGQWFRAVSPAVIKGMLSGIGVLIFASQFHVMVDDKPKGNGVQNLITIPSAIQKGVGWPEFSSTDVRKARTKAIREVGELHRRQVAIAELVTERLPDHSTAEELSHETAKQIEAEVTAVKALVPQQQELSSDVEKIVASLKEFEDTSNAGDKAAKIVAACPDVITTSHLAIQTLEEGQIRSAIAAQNKAVEALSKLSASLKNHVLAAQIGIVTIIVILFWQTMAPKQLQFAPAPLVAVLVAATAATIIRIPVLYVEVPDSLMSELHFPTFAILSDAPWGELITSGFVVAAVASAETLLCATAVDQMQQGPRTKYNKELGAQGVGNMLCGLCGALPMTGVIVRSTANVESGGKTRVSAILHGIWLLVFVAFLTFLLRLIPTSALAAILVYTGYKLINPKSIPDLKKYGWGEVGIYVATVVTIVAADLLSGVIFGIVLAAVKLLHKFSHLEVELKVDKQAGTADLTLTGAATFVRLPKLATALEKVPAQTELRVDLHQLDYIDHACLDLLMNWAKQHESAEGRLILDWDTLHARFRPDTPNAKRNRSVNR